MIEFFRSRIKSFRYAFAGWWHALRTQKNTWVHGLASVSVFVLGFWLHLSRHDWAILILTITMVWIVEFINTALESLTDLLSPQHNSLAKICKDVGAAAVLVAAGASVIIGFLILGPPLWEKIQTMIAN